MNFLIKLSNEEKEIIEQYAKSHNISISEAFKNALFEKIEDEYDEAVGIVACKEYIRRGKKSCPISELWDELDL